MLHHCQTWDGRGSELLQAASWLTKVPGKQKKRQREEETGAQAGECAKTLSTMSIQSIRYCISASTSPIDITYPKSNKAWSIFQRIIEQAHLQASNFDAASTRLSCHN